MKDQLDIRTFEQAMDIYHSLKELKQREKTEGERFSYERLTAHYINAALQLANEGFHATA